MSLTKVTQFDIARLAQVDQTTVSKILTNYPGDSFDKETKQKVFKTAARIGYLHPSVVKPQRRKAIRRKLKAKALIKVRLQDGSLFSECRGEVVNISATGMLLKSLEGGERGLPLKPFYLEIILTNSRLRVPKLKAIPIRFAQTGGPHIKSGCKLGLGIQFFDLAEDNPVHKIVSQ